MAKALVALLFSVASSVLAQECRVVERGFPDVDELRKLERERRELLAATRDLPPFRLGVSERKREAARPSDPAAGSALTLRTPGPREIEIKDADETVRMRVMPGTTEREAAATLDRERARKARETPLEKAIEAGDVAALRRLVAEGADVRTTVRDSLGRPIGWIGRTASRWGLAASAVHGNTAREGDEARKYLAMIDALLAAGSPAADTYYDDSALAFIPYRLSNGQRTPGALEMTERLLRSGARPDAPEALNRRRPLDLAADSGDLELLEAMLRHGRPSRPALDSALQTAFQASRWDAVLRLLGAGANPNRKVRSGNAASLSYALIVAPRLVIKALIAAKADPNVPAGEYPPLMRAVHDHEVMSDLLALGAEPNAVTAYDGMTALHHAVTSDRRSNPAMRAQSVELLLRYGARAAAEDKERRTPLMLASADDPKAIDLLLANGGGVINSQIPPVTWALKQRNETLATALVKQLPDVARADCAAPFHAAESGAASTLAALLDRGVPTKLFREIGAATPLIAAAEAGHVNTALLLLDRGAAQVNEGTPLRVSEGERAELASIAGRPAPELQVLLLQYAKERSGKTALMAAAENGRVEMVQALLERGADPNAQDAAGRSARDYVSTRRPAAVEIRRLLEARGAKPRS